MRILLTGAAGFIGYHLSKALIGNNHEILGIDNYNDYYDPKLKKDRINQLKPFSNFKFKRLDITNKDDVHNEFKLFKPEIVVNLAAQPGVRYSLNNPYAYLNSNLVGFMNIIEACRQYNIEGLIYASSSSVYGGNNKIPFDINDRVDKPLSLYGATKRANELIAFSYSQLYDLKTTGLRFFTVYGPWYRPDMAMFIFINKILSRKTIDVFNNGNLKRDFTYIDDVIDGILLAIEKNYDCEIFNLGNSKSEKLMEMISIIEKNLNIKADIKFHPMQPGDMVETYANINYSNELLNYNPTTSIEAGIPKLIDWYKEYYNC